MASKKHSHLDAMDSAELSAYIESDEITLAEHHYAVKLIKQRSSA